MSGWSKNRYGVKDGAACYRTIGGLRWVWWPQDVGLFKKAGVRHRKGPDGDGAFVHPDDDAKAPLAASPSTIKSDAGGGDNG